MAHRRRFLARSSASPVGVAAKVLQVLAPWLRVASVSARPAAWLAYKRRAWQPARPPRLSSWPAPTALILRNILSFARLIGSAAKKTIGLQSVASRALTVKDQSLMNASFAEDRVTAGKPP